MANPNRMVRSTGGAARNAMGKAYVRPGMAGASAAGRGRGGADSMPKAKAKAKTPDFKVGGSYRSGRTIQGATGTKKRVNRAGAAREGMGSKSGGRATVAGGFGKTMPKKSAAGRGKGGEMMGSNKSSSAQAGKYVKPKAKVSRMRSMY